MGCRLVWVHQSVEGDDQTMQCPMDKLAESLRQNTLVRIIERFGAEHADSHLKDLVIEEIGPGREIVIQGRRVVNFGSDSFLGLDQDIRVQHAIRLGLRRWGTHNGSSRAFASVRANVTRNSGSPSGWASSRR